MADNGEFPQRCTCVHPSTGRCVDPATVGSRCGPCHWSFCEQGADIGSSAHETSGKEGS